jgi:hypothetical protein
MEFFRSPLAENRVMDLVSLLVVEVQSLFVQNLLQSM